MIMMLSSWWRLKTRPTNDIADQHCPNIPRIDDDSNFEDLQNAESNNGISDDDVPTNNAPRQSDRTRKPSQKVCENEEVQAIRGRGRRAVAKAMGALFDA
jgi:hypothetical protein